MWGSVCCLVAYGWLWCPRNTSECPRGHARKAFGDVPWCLPSCIHLKSAYVASLQPEAYYWGLRRGRGRENTCAACRASCRASLIPSTVSKRLDFFHCSMKYIQIHTLFYAINCLKCKMVILCTAELCGTASPIAPPLPWAALLSSARVLCSAPGTGSCLLLAS